MGTKYNTRETQVWKVLYLPLRSYQLTQGDKMRTYSAVIRGIGGKRVPQGIKGKRWRERRKERGERERNGRE